RHGLHLAPRRALAPARLIGRLVAARGERAQARRATQRRLSAATPPRWLAPVSGAAHVVTEAIMQAPLARQTHDYLAHELAVARRDFARRGLQQAMLSPTISLPVAPVVDLLSTTLMPAISAAGATRNSERGTRYMVALRPLAPKAVAEAEPRSAPFGWLCDGWLLVTLLTAIVASVAACVYFFHLHGLALDDDASTHMRIARSVFDSLTPGLAQLGTVWLPLPDVLLWPFVWNNYLWSTGLAGALASMPCFIAASVYIYLIAKDLSGSRPTAYVATLAFILNPNILYLQTTALTESAMLAMFAAAAYFFLRWLRADSSSGSGNLIGLALCIFLATLTRYESWALYVAIACLIVATGALRRWSVRRVLGDLVVYCSLGGFGIALWLGWNALVTGNPLYFQNGAYSPKAQQTHFLAANTLPTFHNWSQTFTVYAVDMVEFIGPAVLLLAISGAVYFGAHFWR
ncbi:MAG: hypothetical protein ACRDID_17470, partial [Ktedonobacterales bacterium]